MMVVLFAIISLQLPFIARFAMAPAVTRRVVSSFARCRICSNVHRPPASTIFSWLTSICIKKKKQVKPYELPRALSNLGISTYHPLQDWQPLLKLEFEHHHLVTPKVSEHFPDPLETWLRCQLISDLPSIHILPKCIPTLLKQFHDCGLLASDSISILTEFLYALCSIIFHIASCSSLLHYSLHLHTNSRYNNEKRCQNLHNFQIQ